MDLWIAYTITYKNQEEIYRYDTPDLHSGMIERFDIVNIYTKKPEPSLNKVVKLNTNQFVDNCIFNYSIFEKAAKQKFDDDIAEEIALRAKIRAKRYAKRAAMREKQEQRKKEQEFEEREKILKEHEETIRQLLEDYRKILKKEYKEVKKEE